ncbi:MAG: potassium transporter TrkG [Candidatus Methanofastidiosia archaeon]
MPDQGINAAESSTEERIKITNVFLYAALLSAAVALIVLAVFLIAETYLHDPLVLRSSVLPYMPSLALVKMIGYVFAVSIFLYLPLKFGIQKNTVTKKSEMFLIIVTTYLFCSILLAFFLCITTEMINYDELLRRNAYSEVLEPSIEKMISDHECSFNLRESLFDAVSGFTTTGLTAFEKTAIPKLDVQPRLIHIIRATYLWIGGLGIMYFYLYFSPVPSLVMSIGYEISADRSFPKFIRLEGLSFSLVYLIITLVGAFLLFSSISNAVTTEGEPHGPVGLDEKTIVTYSVVLSFSSISTGGFSPGSPSINELEIESRPRNRSPIGKYFLEEDMREVQKLSLFSGEQYTIKKYHTIIIDNWGLLILMALMLLGAMPIFSLHRPWKFFKRWIIFVLFVVPVICYAVPSYSDNPQVSIYRAFDAVSAFTTTGLCTSQFESDFDNSAFDYVNRSNIETIENICEYRERCIYMIILMFIGGAAYSTAGGWGFFNLLCLTYAIILILTGKFERVLVKYIRALAVSFFIFFFIFIVGTFVCYSSGLFGNLRSGPEPAEAADYLIDSAFYEISALSTVGFMPETMLQDEGVYHNGRVYCMLLFSMLVGRLYYMAFPFLVSFLDSQEAT